MLHFKTIVNNKHLNFTFVYSLNHSSAYRSSQLTFTSFTFYFSPFKRTLAIYLFDFLLTRSHLLFVLIYCSFSFIARFNVSHVFIYYSFSIIARSHSLLILSHYSFSFIICSHFLLVLIYCPFSYISSRHDVNGVGIFARSHLFHFFFNSIVF